MYQAKILREQGMKICSIATILDVSRRTVYNYLKGRVFKTGGVSVGRPAGSVKLTPFLDFIEQKLDDDLYVSGDLLYQKLCGLGYGGKTTILYDYLKMRRTELRRYAVLRFETVPGQQAQVDWAECGYVWESGIRRKRYCFVMKLGYSRRSYMEFTTSMAQPILFACMKRAFAYFGGVPMEILFDNMKTAFLYDHEKGQWAAHPKMLAFAAHYGFSPRRCRVRRPQTKGKVEREIRYLKSSFFPSLRLDGIDASDLSNASLNERVLSWLKRVDEKTIRELGQSRKERFEADYGALKGIVTQAFDHRTDEPLKTSLEATIRFQNNTYSVDAAYRGKMLSGKYDPDMSTLSVYFGKKEIKTIPLQPAGKKEKVIAPQDHLSLIKAWEEDRERYERIARRRIEKKKRRAQVENTVAHPSVYDEAFGVSMSTVELEEVAA